MVDTSLSTAISPRQQLTNVSIEGMLLGLKSVDPSSIARAWESSSGLNGRSA